MNTQCLSDLDFPKSVSRYRLAYWSVTGFFDAPALANQGTILATQYPLGRIKLIGTVPNVGLDRAKVAEKQKATEGDKRSVVRRILATNGEEVPPDLDAVPMAGGMVGWMFPVEACVDDPRPFSVLQTMPNAYMGLAKDGFYVPGRINKFKWRLARDQRFFLGY